MLYQHYMALLTQGVLGTCAGLRIAECRSVTRTDCEQEPPLEGDMNGAAVTAHLQQSLCAATQERRPGAERLCLEQQAVRDGCLPCIHKHASHGFAAPMAGCPQRGPNARCSSGTPATMHMLTHACTDLRPR